MYSYQHSVCPLVSMTGCRSLEPRLAFAFVSAEHMAFSNQNVKLAVPISYLEIELGLSPCSVEQFKCVVCIFGFVCALAFHNQYAN